MFDESTRAAIALKRFSLISPVINGQVKNNMAYYLEVTREPIEMPYYGIRKYSPKTLESWYCDYMKGGIDALKPGLRGDRGCFRKIDTATKEKIIEVRNKFPRAPSTVIYETLLKDNIIDTGNISDSTVYRFLKNVKNISKTGENDEDAEMKRYSHQYPGELWQTDLMYGPYIGNGKKREQTFLSAFIDDATRLITHAEFFFEQNFEILRNSFKDAVLKRGIPRLIYTDNGKIYRSQQFEWLCASLGTVLIHSKPFVPNSRGKIERFFHTVRKRFLSGLDIESVKNLEELNIRFWKWLNDDYQKKPHSGLNGMTPLDSFMANISKVNIPDDPLKLKEKFYLRIKRKVNPDATLSINSLLYETDSRFSNSKIELRFEPEWIGNIATPLLVYKDDKNIGTARLINFHDNAHMRRKGRDKKINSLRNNVPEQTKEKLIPANIIPVPRISFKDILGEEK